MTQFKQINFSSQGQMQLDLPGLKRVKVNCAGGSVCSDGGLLLLRKADERLGLTKLASYAIDDKRRPEYIRHSIVEMLQQRIYAIASGYEDCNDASLLRRDAMHMLAAGQNPDSGQHLASQPSMSRFENSVDKQQMRLYRDCWFICM
ncbi:MAG: transposase [Candidatus Melainabacteria bacterium]|nr:transposase [Candidatus Melainabacteria bacterium]